MTTQTFNNIVDALPHVGGLGKAHRVRMETLLRALRAKGYTLEQCSGPLYLGRTIKTLQKHCRRIGLTFPDYIPTKIKRRRALSAKRRRDARS